MDANFNSWDYLGVRNRIWQWGVPSPDWWEFLLQTGEGAYKSTDGLVWTYWGPFGGSNRDYVGYSQGRWWARNGSLLRSSLDGKAWADMQPSGDYEKRSFVDPESNRVLVISDESIEVDSSGNERTIFRLYEFANGEWTLLKTLVDRLFTSGPMPNVMVVQGEIRIIDESGNYSLDEYVFNDVQHWPDPWWSDAVFSYANGQYIGATEKGVYTSKEGSKWVFQSTPVYQGVPIGQIVYGNDVYVSSTRMGSSLGALEPHGRDFNNVLYFKGVFIGANATDLRYSTDGVAWSPAIGGLEHYGQIHMAASNERVVLSSGSGILSSNDGVEWTFTARPEERDFESLAYGGGFFIGFQGDSAFRSTDGLSWVPSGVADHPSVSGANVYDLGYYDGRFLASLDDYGLFSSSDGGSWEFVGPMSFSRFVTGITSAIMQSKWGVSVMGAELGTPLEMNVLNPSGQYAVQTGSAIEIGFEAFSPLGAIEHVRVFRDGVFWKELDPATRRLDYSPELAGKRDIRIEIENTIGEMASITVSVEATPKIYTTIPEKDFWLNDLVYFKGAYYGAGEGGKIFQSLDGVSWKGIQTPALNRIQAMETDGSVIVAKAFGDGILFSEDGISWLKTGVFESNTYNDPQPADFRSMDFMTYSNGLFVFGEYISEDGIHWYSGDTGDAFDRSGSVELGKKRVYSGPYNTSYFGGIGHVSDRLTWEVGNQLWNIRDVHPIGGQYVGIANREIIRSFNLEEWDAIEPDRFDLSDSDQIKLVGDLFFIIDHSNVKWVSSNGVDWNEVGSVSLRGDVSFSDGIYYAMGSTGTEGFSGPNVSLFRSIDGRNWIPQGIPQSGAYSTGFEKIVASPVGIVLLSRSWFTDNEVSFTTDGTEWLHRSYDNQDFREHLEIVEGDPLLALGEGALYSRDSEGYWVPTGLKGTRNAAYLKGLYLAEFSNREFGTSMDLENWIRYESPPEIDRNDYLFSDGEKAFWIPGYDDLLHRSEDGITWETRPLPVNADELYDIFYFKERLYYANRYGSLFASVDDGFSWTQTTTGQDSWAITHTGELMGTIINGTKFFVSQDGEVWEERNFPAGSVFELYATDESFYALGDAVWRSKDGFSWEKIAPYRVKAAASRSHIQFYREHFSFIDFVNTDIEITSALLVEKELEGGVPAQAKVELKNLGSDPAQLVEGAYLDVILDSSGGVFGLPLQGDGVHITATLESLTIDPGEVVEIDVFLDVPDEIAPGDYYLNLALSENAVLYDGNTSNDFFLSEVAELTVPGYFLEIQKVGLGEIDGYGNNQMYRKDAKVNLLANPRFGYEFTGWSGDHVTGEEIVSFKMDRDYALTATFVPRKYLVDVEATTGGVVNGIPEEDYLEFGTNLHLVATPDDGWTFVGWTGSAGGVGNELELSIGRDVSFVAQFGQTYNQWFASRFGDEINKDFNVDRDGNGLTNLEDYAFGTHSALEAQAIDLGMTYDGASLRFRYALSKQAIGIRTQLYSSSRLNSLEGSSLLGRKVAETSNLEIHEVVLPVNSATDPLFLGLFLEIDEQATN